MPGNFKLLISTTLYMYCLQLWEHYKDSLIFIFTNEIDEDNDCYSAEDRTIQCINSHNSTIRYQETNHSEEEDQCVLFSAAKYLSKKYRYNQKAQRWKTIVIYYQDVRVKDVGQ